MQTLIKKIAIIFFLFMVISPVLMILYVASYDLAGQFASLSWRLGIPLCGLAILVILAIPAFKHWDWKILSQAKWQWVWVPPTAIALAVISTIFVSKAWHGLPGLFIFYWLLLFWIVAISMPIYIVSDWYSRAVNSAVGWVIGQLWTNNNARFWLLATLFANFTLLAILYGPPVRTDSFALKPVGIQALKKPVSNQLKKLVNDVASNKTLNDVGGFILFGKESPTSPMFIEAPASIQNQTPPKPRAEKGWGFVIFAMFFGFLTIVYLPFAFADEIFAWLKSHVSRQKKEIETDTEEAKPVEGRSPSTNTGFLRKFIKFSIVDLFWDLIFWVFPKITKSSPK